jgi:acyl-CoA thioesterase-1
MTSEDLMKFARLSAYVLAPVGVFIAVAFFLAGRGGSGEGGPPQAVGPDPTVATSSLASASSTETLIIAMGDSITAGYGLRLEEAWPAVLEHALRGKGYAVRVVNAGVSGETTAGGLRRAEFIARQDPDIIILALGGNDALRGIDPAATRNQLAGTLEMLQMRSRATVVLAGMLAPRNMGESYALQFDAIYPALAEEFHVPLIPFILEGVALDPELNQSDGIHPNAKGQEIIAMDVVLPMTETLLKK